MNNINKPYIVGSTHPDKDNITFSPYFEDENFDKLSKDRIGIVCLPIFYAKITLKLVHSLFVCQHCNQCCTKCEVRVDDIEVPIIANYLNVRTRKIKHLLDNENNFKHSPCLFLKENRCSIYPVRPLTCMIYPFIPIIHPYIDDKQPVISVFQCKGGKLITPKLKEMIKVVNNLSSNKDTISIQEIKNIVNKVL